MDTAGYKSPRAAMLIRLRANILIASKDTYIFRVNMKKGTML